ncbi:MAG TPA: hypothetical protein VKU41_15015, partial [Polyangiaceae bacterium]|nr:hypothetical protein [Polyangiaceae bacterium]
MNPLPTTNSLYAVWEASPTDIWAAGDLGTIEHFDGSQWTLSPSGTSKALRAMWGTSSSDVWAVGDAATVLHWNGTAWSAMTSPANVDLRGIWGLNGNQVWMAGGSGSGSPLAGAVVSWNGSSLSTLFSSTTARFDSIWAAAPDKIWVGGMDTTLTGTVWSWDGAAWTSSVPVNGPYGSVSLLWGSGPSDIWALIGTSHTLYWNGSFWTDVSSTARGSAERYASQAENTWWGTGPNDVWTPGGYHWDGGAWGGTVLYGCTTEAVAVSGTSSDDLWFAGGAGGVSTWNGTRCANSAPSGWREGLSVIWASSPDDVYFAGGDSATAAVTIRHWDGSNWTTSALPAASPDYTFMTPTAMWGSATNDIWMTLHAKGVNGTGDDGFVSHWDGQVWSSPQSLSFPDFPVDIWGSGPNDVWAITAGS